MINKREIHYSLGLLKNEIDYFLRYKNQLKKFSIDNRQDISKVNMNKIFIEVEKIALHLFELKKQEKELLTLLDKIYYGNNATK